MIEAGHYESARKAAAAELVVAEERFGPDSPEVARAYDRVVEAMWRGGKACDPECLQLAAEAVRRSSDLHGIDSRQVAVSLWNLGHVRWGRAEYAAARLLFEDALGIGESQLGRDDPLLVEILYGLAEVHRLEGDLETSEALHRRGLRIAEDLGSDGRAVGQALNGLANVIADQGDPDVVAVSLYRQSAAMREDALGDYHPDVAVSLHNLAYQLYWEGHYREALSVGDRALGIQDKSLAPNNPLIARTAMYLALINTENGYARRAVELYERVLEINSRALSPRHPRRAEAYIWYATLLTQIGDYIGARKTLEEALAIDEAGHGTLAANRSLWVRELLAVVAARIGDASEAERLFTKISSEMVDGEWGLHYSENFNENLADFYREIGRVSDARELYQKQLDHWGESAPERSRILLKLAWLECGAGNAVAAEPLFEYARTGRFRASGMRHPEVADSLFGSAQVAASRRDLDDAARLCQQGLDLLETVYGKEHPRVAFGLGALARYQEALGHTYEAFDSALRAEELGQRHLAILVRGMAEREALQYDAARPKGLDAALSIQGSQNDPSLVERTWNQLIVSRAAVLDEMAARTRLVADSTDPEDLRLANDLAAARERLAYLIVAGPNERHPEMWPQLVADARHERNRAERILAERTRIRSESQRVYDVSLKNIAAALPENAALVAYAGFNRIDAGGVGCQPAGQVAGSSDYVAFVARRDGQPVAVPLGPAKDIDDLVDRIRRETSRPSESYGERLASAESAYRAAGTELRRTVWDPIIPHVTGIETVFVVPDGSLNLVDFAALPVGASRYLADSGLRVQYLSAERDFHLEGEDAPISRALLIGAPAFDDGLQKTAYKSDNPTVEKAVPMALPERGGLNRGRSSDAADLRTMNFDPLPHSSREIDDVAAILKRGGAIPGQERERRPSLIVSPEVIRLTGTLATERGFKELAPGQHLLHIATHGFFIQISRQSLGQDSARRNPSRAIVENPLLLSGLALAGANPPETASSDEEDGILTAEEIASVDLSGVEWAVLSACDTGVGEVVAGEGVFGLRRAFQIAGARTLIMSLWPVDDEVTRAWMRELYTNRFVNGMSTIDSVHEASLALLNERREKGLSTHPFYWAGFIASGDWR